MPSAKSKAKAKSALKTISENLNEITKDPEEFLVPQEQRTNDVLKLMQQTYCAAVQQDDSQLKDADILPELLLEEMDTEQIWQQLELRSTKVLPQYLKITAKLLALDEQNLEVQLDESDGEEQEEQDDEEAEDNESIDDGNELQDEEVVSEEESDDEYERDNFDEPYIDKVKNKKKKTRKSVVDDKFFKLSEMEEFLEQEDAKELRKQKGKPALNDADDGIDYFTENLGDNEEEDSDADNVNYKDFFDDDEDLEVKAPKSDKKSGKDFFADNADEDADENENDQPTNSDGEGDSDAGLENAQDSEKLRADQMEPASDSDDDDNNYKKNMQNDDEDEESESEQEEETEAQKSSFELREARLQQRIRDYEQEMLGEKSWQLKGEVKAGSRPQNSLLEEILEFDATTRPAPVITEETTRCLEDIIKQRIRDQAWDDVELKLRPKLTPQDYRKQLVLDQEKSKESLAQIYEKEYQREVEKLNPNRDEAGNEPEPKEHQEIRKAMRELFIKLDALTNFHFTPKPVAPEAKIITNTPAIAMEEVAPVAVSDAKLLAPEEVFRGPKHGLVGKSERTRTDKNRERRKKKQKQRAIHNALEKRDQQRLKDGKPLSKKVEGAKLLKSITKHRNVEKITTSNDHGSLKSSKTFFNKLQDTTSSNGVAQKRAAKKPFDATKINPKKLKL